MWITFVAACVSRRGVGRSEDGALRIEGRTEVGPSLHRFGKPGRDHRRLHRPLVSPPLRVDSTLRAVIIHGFVAPPVIAEVSSCLRYRSQAACRA
jgi:hypothetical protein